MILRTLILIALLLSSASTALAAPEGIGTKTVRRVNAKLSKTLASKTKSTKQEGKLLKEARGMLGNFLNIEELGQRAMRDHWPTLSKAQRTEFLSLLRSLIETNYVKGLRANVKYEVSYLGEKSQGEHLLVQTIVKSERKGRPLKIEIDYLLSRSGETWRTFDMMTDGIGLVENYRAMFNKIISKSGFDELLKRMKTRLAAMSN
ncbi:MAG: ABC transporter substrate-binding protein [Myxococcales bacterium]|nr:ABC transporter substrate-binding protein [Myxococcales bacterium]